MSAPYIPFHLQSAEPTVLVDINGHVIRSPETEVEFATLKARIVELEARVRPTNEDLAGVMADYCVDVLKVETDRAQIVASYMRDMESSDGHSYGRMVRYLADRLFGKVKP